MKDRLNEASRLKLKEDDGITLREGADPQDALPGADDKVPAQPSFEPDKATPREEEPSTPPHGGRSDGNGETHRARWFSSASPGLRRHQLITLGCFALALALLSLSVFDLSSLIQQDATLDSSMHLALAKARPSLPPNIHYAAKAKLSDGMYQVSELTWQGERFGFANEAGQVVVPPQFIDVKDFSDGLAGVHIDTSDSTIAKRYRQPGGPLLGGNSGWGFINSQGKMVIRPEYTAVEGFHDGVAVVTDTQAKSCLINKQGQVVSPLMDNAPERFGSAIIAQHPRQMYGLMGVDGTWLSDHDYDRIQPIDEVNGYFRSYRYDGLPVQPPTAKGARFLAWKGNECGVIDITGKVLLPIAFSNVYSFQNGHAIVQAEGHPAGERRIVDSNGKIVLETEYQFLTPYDNLMAGLKDEKWEFLNKKGEKVPMPAINSVVMESQNEWFSEGRGAVLIDGKCGFVDRKGKLVIPARFDYVRAFHNGVAPVWLDGGWRFINRKGNFVTPRLASVSEFKDGTAGVSVAGLLYDLTEAKAISAAQSQIKGIKLNLQSASVFR